MYPMGSTLFSKREVRRYSYRDGRNRSPRPKSFKTEALAKAWAEANCKKYEVVKKLHSDKYIVKC